MSDFDRNDLVKTAHQLAECLYEIDDIIKDLRTRRQEPRDKYAEAMAPAILMDDLARAHAAALIEAGKPLEARAIEQVTAWWYNALARENERQLKARSEKCPP